MEHSAILSTFIKLSFVIKFFVLSIFEWPFYSGFTVFQNSKTQFIEMTLYHSNKIISIIIQALYLLVKNIHDLFLSCHVSHFGKVIPARCSIIYVNEFPAFCVDDARHLFLAPLQYMIYDWFICATAGVLHDVIKLFNTRPEDRIA